MKKGWNSDHLFADSGWGKFSAKWTLRLVLTKLVGEEKCLFICVWHLVQLLGASVLIVSLKLAQLHS